MIYEIPSHLIDQIDIAKVNDEFRFILSPNHSKEAAQTASKMFRHATENDHYTYVGLYSSYHVETDSDNLVVFWGNKPAIGNIMLNGFSDVWDLEYGLEDVINYIERIRFIRYDDVGTQYISVPQQDGALARVLDIEVDLTLDQTHEEIRLYCDTPEEYMRLKMLL